MSSDSVDVSLPEIAVNRDTVHVTWFGDKLRLPYVRSLNGGLTWESLRDLLSDTIYHYPGIYNKVLVNRSDVTIIYSELRLGRGLPPKLIKSIDGGRTWLVPQQITPDTNNSVFTAAIINDTLAIAYTNDSLMTSLKPHVWISTDGGETWSRRARQFLTNFELALSPDALHMVDDWSSGRWGEVMYKNSHDLGETWNDSMMLSMADGITSIGPSIAAHPTNGSVYVTWREPRLGCIALGYCNVALRQSRDNGIAFIPEFILTTQPTGHSSIIATCGTIVAVAWVDNNYPTFHSTIHVRISLDGGLSWCPEVDVNPDIWHSTYVSITVSQRGVHLASLQGVGDSTNQTDRIFYRSGTLLPTGVEEQTPLPANLSLQQNYPNPFNPTTVISFQLPVSSFVTLKVYNLLGEEITTLVNEKMEAGEHTVQWNAENVTSGIYFYRIITETYTETRKAVVMR